MNNRLIMYNINNIAKEKQLKELCNRLNIQTKRLNGKDTDKALVILAGVNAKAGNGMHANIKNGNIKTGSNLSTKSGNMPMILPEIIIFSGITDEELDTFLKEYKSMNIDPIRLKAILTIYNINWTLGELITELIKESNSF
ncbi:MAG: DUF3783 domain-containing protein [Lachnospiraceae bacterium]|nr:DUF3783 domain-containing protein [Lachnospiraceae bacterium]